MPEETSKKHSGKYNASAFFPDLLQRTDLYARQKQQRAKPPPPPNVKWLGKDAFAPEAEIQDIPGALILIRDSGKRGAIEKTLEQYGYRIEFTQSVAEARFKLANMAYEVVAFHPDFEESEVPERTEIHQFMTKLPMSKRRRIFYVVFGPHLTTLYNLETLALSANLIINDNEIKYLPMIFQKGYQEYLDLFGPLLEVVDTSR